MPKPIPVKTPDKEGLPPETKMPEMPTGFKLKINNPAESIQKEEIPNQTESKEEIPNQTEEKENIPDQSEIKEELPSDLIEENCVIVDGNKIEIKPTKLKYFRNQAASGYGVIKAIPVTELYRYQKGVLDPHRDADQLVYDFLVAAFNDSSFVRNNYNEMDADLLDRVCKIFGRINHIDEKEEAARKNREAQEQAKR